MTRSGSIGLWLRVLRPKQWTKNAFVLAPLLFSGKALDTWAQRRVLATFVLSCVMASAAYLLNDVVDRRADRVHPAKRERPIASDAISWRAALVVAALLGLAGIVPAFWINTRVGALLVGYAALNVAYTFVLKNVVIVDVFSIAGFFILRLLVGSAAAEVVPSVWLLLCGGLLALLLGFSKRRHELLVFGESPANHRSVLANYSTVFLDQILTVLLSLTAVCYIMYTLESDTARAIGSPVLVYSTVFVLYGVLRYLYVSQRMERAIASAEELLLDRSLLIAVSLWAVYCAIAIYAPAVRS